MQFILLNISEGGERFTLCDSDNMERDSKKHMGYNIYGSNLVESFLNINERRDGQ